jgi:hypothetical protein
LHGFDVPRSGRHALALGQYQTSNAPVINHTFELLIRLCFCWSTKVGPRSHEPVSKSGKVVSKSGKDWQILKLTGVLFIRRYEPRLNRKKFSQASDHTFVRFWF